MKAGKVLPFERFSDGSGKELERFCADFFLARPKLPDPTKEFALREVVYAEAFGGQGHTQRGIDIQLDAEGGEVWGVQLKQEKNFGPKKAFKAMDLAEERFPEAAVYVLIRTGARLSPKVITEARRRRNWLVADLEHFSRLVLNDHHLPRKEQVKLIKDHFDEEALRELFPTPTDEVLIPAKEFFSRYEREGSLHRHDAPLIGEAAKRLMIKVVDSQAQARVISAPGGVGKSRLLKELATKFEKVLFVNEAADFEAEIFYLRGLDLSKTMVFVDDGHRIQNLRKRVLEKLRKDGGKVVVATRPGARQTIIGKLRDCGFEEVEDFDLPCPDYEDRLKIADLLLHEKNEKLARWLARQSQGCVLVCSVGAELLNRGKLDKSLIGSEQFARVVFERLREVGLEVIYGEDASMRKSGLKILRLISLLGPVHVDDSDGGNLEIASNFLKKDPWEVQERIGELMSGGLLAQSREGLRVIPDLLADNIVFEVAYGEGRLTSFVRQVLKRFSGGDLVQIISNLASAEWRARQVGIEEDYLTVVWGKILKTIPGQGEISLYRLVEAWKPIAAYQPDRTMDLVQRLRSVFAKKRSGILLHRDSDLMGMLQSVARHHQEFIRPVLDELWDMGLHDDEDQVEGVPSPWSVIAKLGDLSEYGLGEEVFGWIQNLETKVDQDLEKFYVLCLSKSLFGRSFRTVRTPAPGLPASEPISKEALPEFRLKVVGWIGNRLHGGSPEKVWKWLPILSRATSPWFDSDQKGTLGKEVMVLFTEIQAAHSSSAIQLKIWRICSDRLNLKSQNPDRNARFTALRNKISHDWKFRCLRLGTSYEDEEWRREMLKPIGERDRRKANAWWENEHVSLASKFVEMGSELVPFLDELDEFLRDSSRFFETTIKVSWLAEKWAQADRKAAEGICSYLRENPGHELAKFYARFAFPIETSVWRLFDLGLATAEEPIVSSVLMNLRRVEGEAPALESSLRKLCLDPHAAEILVRGSAMLSIRVPKYFYLLLEAFDYGILDGELLSMLASNIGTWCHGREMTPVHLVKPLLNRMSEVEDIPLFKSWDSSAEYALENLQKNYPEQMSDLYFARIEAFGDRALPAQMGMAFGDQIRESEHYVDKAREILKVALGENKNQSEAAAKLFVKTIVEHDPQLAARLLTEDWPTKITHQLFRVLGGGLNSLILKEPDLTKKILLEIEVQDAPRIKNLRAKFLGRVLMEEWSQQLSKWVAEDAEALFSNFRNDTILASFYRDLVELESRQQRESEIKFFEGMVST